MIGRRGGNHSEQGDQCQAGAESIPNGCHEVRDKTKARRKGVAHGI